MIKKINLQKGQSLIEVIVAMAIFAIMSGAIMSVTLGSLNGLTQGGEETEAKALTQEGMEAIRSVRDDAWNNLVYSPASVATSSNAWFISEDVSELINNKYTRIITISNVCRDGSNNIATCPATYIDPHTKFASTTVSWSPRNGATNIVEQFGFISNWDSYDWTQTDWSGGNGQTNWSSDTKYDTDDSKIDVTTSGEVKLATVSSIPLVKDSDFEGSTNTSYDWPFTTAGNYTYDTDAIEVTGGVARLNSSGGDPIDGNTKGMWHLDEASGTVVDYSGNSNDLSNVKGSPSYNQSGKFSTSLQFNANSSRYINNGQQTGLGITGPITIDAWVYKTSAATTNQAIISKWRETGNKRSYALILNSSNKLQFYLSSNGSNATSVSAVNQLPLNSWVHIAAVYDGVQMYIFQNGILENSIAYSGGISDEAAFVSVSGADSFDGGDAFFNGKIDEARVSDIARWTGAFTVPSGVYGAVSYASDSPTINPSSSFTETDVISWDSFTEIATKNGGQIYYQLSDDSGSTWQYWDGSAWSAVSLATDYNTATDINTNIGTFDVTAEKILFKAFLESDGSQQVQLDNINIGFSPASSAWTFNTWNKGSGEVTPTGTRQTSGGNPTGYADIDIPSNAKNDEVGGFWQQTIEVANNGDTLTCELDWKVFDWVAADGVDDSQLYVFLDSTSGDPSIGTEIWSSGILSGTSGWTGVSFDCSAAASTAGTYYIKIAQWLDTANAQDTGPITIGYDDVGINSSASAYQTSGSFVSSAFDMSDASPVQVIEWDETKPANTDIQVQVRTAPDSGGSHGTWTDWFGISGASTFFSNHFGSLIPIDLNGNQWVQYRVDLSGDGSDTPILEEIRVNYK
ncbi:MAG: prepilin-type N-terminal cleavage/methylation domain-containing protein [Parcubacteria group bacterium]|nr:prepilin-type N-terminal cleavage/methylation domain-containing protein [Parcubacteria group bacterium]